MRQRSFYLRAGDLDSLAFLAASLNEQLPPRARTGKASASELLEMIGQGKVPVTGNVASKNPCYATSIRLSAVAIKGLTAIARSHNLSLSALVRAIAAKELTLGKPVPSQEYQKI